jgi:hypothetical protein
MSDEVFFLTSPCISIQLNKTIQSCLKICCNDLFLYSFLSNLRRCFDFYFYYFKSDVYAWIVMYYTVFHCLCIFIWFEVKRKVPVLGGSINRRFRSVYWYRKYKIFISWRLIMLWLRYLYMFLYILSMCYICDCF